MDTAESEAFLRWFASNSRKLMKLPRDQAFEQIQGRIVQVDHQLTIELSDEGTNAELIISANGRRELFENVRALGTRMGGLGWEIIALKPARGFEFTIDVGGISIVASNLRFNPLRGRDKPAKSGICLGVFRQIPRDAARDVAKIIVEAGIGEELASAIDFMDTVDSPPQDFDSWLPIADLAEYRRWLQNRPHG